MTTADVGARAMGALSGSRVRWLALGIPSAAWLLGLVVAPVVILLAYSTFQVRDATIVVEPTISNYLKVLGDPLYQVLLLRSIGVAAAVAIIAAAIAYPLALVVVSTPPAVRQRLVVLVLLPLWVGFLVRILAWQVLLGRNGTLNAVLTGVGVIDEPLSVLLYSPFAVLITLVYVNIPFVFIPVYVSLERIPRALDHAAHDLGAGTMATFRHVILPLSAPGLAVGMTFAFIEALGDYVTPTLVGGPGGVMIGRVIVSQFGLAFNWPLGASMAFVVLAVTLVILAVVARLGGREVFLE